MLEKYPGLRPKTKDVEKIGEVRGTGDILKEMLLRFRATVEGGKKTETEELETTPKDIFPTKAEDIVATEYLGGSSDVMAGYFEDRLLVIKKAREVVNEATGALETNSEQLIDEYVADRIYEAMGFGVPVSRIYEKGRYKVANFIPGKDLNTFSG